MKKFLAIMLAALMLLGLTACGGTKKDNVANSDNTAESISDKNIANQDNNDVSVSNENIANISNLEKPVKIESLLNKDIKTLEEFFGTTLYLYAEINDEDEHTDPYITYVSENNEWVVEVDFVTKDIMSVSYVGSNPNVTEEDKAAFLDMNITEVKDKTGMNFFDKDDDSPFITKTGWSFWVDINTKTVVDATYCDGSETVNGLTMNISYNEAVDILKGQGYKIATDETLNILLFATEDDSFVGRCAFDCLGEGSLGAIEADCSGGYIDRVLEWNQ